MIINSKGCFISNKAGIKKDKSSGVVRDKKGKFQNQK